MIIYGVYLGDYEGGHFDSFYLNKTKAKEAALIILEQNKKETKMMQEHDMDEDGIDEDYKDWVVSADNPDEWKGGHMSEYSISIDEVEVIE